MLRGGTYITDNCVWKFVRRLTLNTPQVEHLALGRSPLRQVVENIDIPSLRYLYIARLAPSAIIDDAKVFVDQKVLTINPLDHILF